MAVWSEVALSEVELTRIDAEFYKPEYLAAKKAAGDRKLKSYGVAVLHPAEFTRRYSDAGHFILLAQNNRDNHYDWSTKKRVSPSLLPAILRNRLEFGDVTITRSGANYGQTSAIGLELKKEPVYACADLLILRSQSIDGHLISTFLNSSVGKLLLDRGGYGAAQPHIAPSYIKEIPFPEVLRSVELEIKELILDSRKLTMESEERLVQAQTLLDSALGLNQLSAKNPISYTTQASAVADSRRMDAEYYGPAAREVVRKIIGLQHTTLRDSFSVQSGFPWNSAKFISDSSGEPVVRIRNIRPNFIVPDELTSIQSAYAKSIGAAKAHRGDVVVGMDGIKYFYASLLEGDCFINQRVCHLSPLTNSSISSEYAVFMINSIVGQAQLMRDMTVATTVGHITNRNVANLVLPTISQSFHDEITGLIRRSIDCIEESKRLVKQAKNRVEQLIEEAVHP